MNKTIFAFLIVLSIGLMGVSNMYCQSPDTLWTRTYGGSERDGAYAVEITADGGLIIAGFTRSFAYFVQAYLIKTNSDGDTIWTKRYGGGDAEEARSVQQTSDGGYIVAGYTRTYGAGNYDVYLIKTDSLGDTLWTKTYGGSEDDRGYCVLQTGDGGYIAVGYTCSFGPGNRAVYLIRTDSLGDSVWTKAFGGDSSDAGYTIRMTLDNGFIITGYTYSYGSGECDMYLIKTNENGDSLWAKTYGGAYYESESGESVQLTSDGGYVIVGWKDEITYEWQAYIVKVDSGGNIQWQRTYGGTNYEWGYSILEAFNGGYVISGYTQSYGAGGKDVYLIRTNSSGDTIWTKTIGGTGDDVGWSVIQTAQHEYIIAGITTSFGAGMADAYLIKMEADVGIDEEKDSRGSKNFDLELQCVPNPFKSGLQINFTLQDADFLKDHQLASLKVYDLSGRRVKEATISIRNKNRVSFFWDGKDAINNETPAGIYLLELSIGEFSRSQKVLKLK